MINSSPYKDEDEEEKYKPAPLMIKIVKKKLATPEPQVEQPKEPECLKEKEMTESEK